MTTLVVDLTKEESPLSVIRGNTLSEVILITNRVPDPAVLSSALNAVAINVGKVTLQFPTIEASINE